MEVSPQTPKLFTLFNYYRFLVSTLLLAMTFSRLSPFDDYRSEDFFQITALAYVIFNITLLGLNKLSLSANPKQIFMVISFDILILHTLFFFATGVSGGLSSLVIITVAAGNIMIRGRIGLSFAAIASLMSLVIEIERFLKFDGSIGDITGAGILGIIYFASAYILQSLSLRVSQSESLASQRQQDLIELQELNHKIIQSMRTGIIVCDETLHIKTLNEACNDLIDLKSGQVLPQALAERVELWIKQPNLRTTPFQVSHDKPMVQANFSRLLKDKGADVIIFLDDIRRMSQKAQQLKLASLGRLTASIAHEVRNPLGAISHATQLLAESDELAPADRKMTDIIQRHSNRVNMIIENTLQLSRRSEPALEDLVIADWLKKVKEDYQEHQNPNAKVKVTINQDDAMARFDPSQIEQVLVNLMDNGIRHSRTDSSQGEVEIILNSSDDGEQSYIEVIDQGPGVPESNIAHLFEPFFTTANQGSGLGLYLSRELCEANQARLDYRGHSKPGTCFRITFAHYNKMA